ncbi:MAG: translation initiation factor IF-2 [Dehalococcoidia bacterium]|nr:translation initiation factor IF-2 [Dehalococcoidia bacterium]MSQ34278.1 translation initiation factor IF-2 [Dehalococcoidia bacterium]
MVSRRPGPARSSSRPGPRGAPDRTPARGAPGRGRFAAPSAPPPTPVPSRPAAPAVPVAPVELPAQLSVGELSAILKHSPIEIIKALMRAGIMANINQMVDFDTAARVAVSLGIPVRKPKAKQESTATQRVGSEEQTAEGAQERPPVVTVMGHVDHGKTTLLDAIRGTTVASGEAGGITQSIGAYQVEKNGRKITFIDTPGHAAFTAMRASGAQVTDVVVIVVAANDGVQPQTIEAIDHARAAKVPIIVAINKVDATGADPDKVKGQLTEHGIVVEGYGGDVVAVEVSALKKTGIDELLESILLVADVAELKANPERTGIGVVIESHMDRARGPIATVIVRGGTLKVGDNIVAGIERGRIRQMVDGFGKEVATAGPSTPAQIMGLGGLPGVGDQLDVVEGERTARMLVETRERITSQRGEVRAAPTLADVMRRVRSGETKQLNLVIKTGTQGAVDAVRRAVEQLSTQEVLVNIVHVAAGGVAESDVMLSAASQAVLLAYDTEIEAGAARQAAQQGVEIRHYKIIYELVDHVAAAAKGLVKPEEREVVAGHAVVQQVFKLGKRGKIAGVRITDGVLRRNATVRALRKGKALFIGKVSSMRHLTENVNELATNFEGGVVLDGFTEFEAGDVLEAIEVRITPA